MAPPDLVFPPGTEIASQYQLGEIKGGGASGVVYSARNLYNDQPVALKFLREYPQGDELDAILYEIGVGKLVNHPNVCKLHDVGTTADGILFLAMEYVDGQNLEELIAQCGHPSRDDAVRKAIDICSGLAAIHEKSFVHRDLKPANVMIDKKGRAKITDLGAAVRANLPTSVFRGTPLYKAPETWRNALPQPSEDIYSLGLLLFKIFTGKTCLGAPRTMDELWRAYANARFRRPSDETTGLDASIDHIVSLCLEETPGDRRSAIDLRALLEALQ